MATYNIVRKFYRDIKRINGALIQGVRLRVPPMTQREAHTVKGKLCPPKNAIEYVVEISSQ